MDSKATVKEFLLGAASKDINYEDIFKMAGNFLFSDEALKKEISVLSGGEKARLCLAGILLEKSHVLLLDEPTNHLDFETVEALAAALSESNSTIFFVSHNRAFVETLANGIIEVKNGKASRYLHDYENYVYHMQKAIEEDLQREETDQKSHSSKSSKISPVAAPSAAEKNGDSRSLLKKAKNKIYKLETAIKKMEEEKQILDDWFEAHPTEYSEEKSVKLGELISLLTGAESEWLAVQEEVAKLS